MELKSTETLIEQAKLLANDFSNNNSNYNIGGKDELRMVADPD